MFLGNVSVKVGIPMTILENQEMYDVVLYIGLLKCKHLFRDIAELDLYNGLPEHYTHCENNSES